MTDRTLRAIGKRYDDERNTKLKAIKEGKISASMSGMEYYPKAWDDLDMNNSMDADTIGVYLAWDGDQHTHTGLRPYCARELELNKERMELMRKPHEERRFRINEIDKELNFYNLTQPYSTEPGRFAGSYTLDDVKTWYTLPVHLIT